MFDEIAVEGELTDERVHLAQGHGDGGPALEVAADEAVAGSTHFQRRLGGVVHDGCPVLLGEGEQALEEVRGYMFAETSADRGEGR